MRLIIAIIVILITWCAMVAPATAMNMTELEEFLVEDTTDQHELVEWYSCGHFARDLARNASAHNLTIGSVLMSNHPTFRGRWNSHSANYVDINRSIFIIEPTKDGIYPMTASEYDYLRFYQDGTMVPSNWAHNLAHHVDLWNFVLD